MPLIHLSLFTSMDNEFLFAAFLFEEFKETIFSMKNCGHDIFTAGCTLKVSVIFPPSLITSSTNIDLIPIGEVYSSIALCNVLYKVVVKVLANMLKVYLISVYTKINQLLCQVTLFSIMQ